MLIQTHQYYPIRMDCCHLHPVVWRCKISLLYTARILPAHETESCLLLPGKGWMIISLAYALKHYLLVEL